MTYSYIWRGRKRWIGTADHWRVSITNNPERDVLKKANVREREREAEREQGEGERGEEREEGGRGREREREGERDLGMIDGGESVSAYSLGSIVSKRVNRT